MPESRAHRRLVRKALEDTTLQTALARASKAYKTARVEGMKDFDLRAAQEEVRRIKERSVDRMGELFEIFREEAQKVGAVVHEAADGEAAAAIIIGLARERGVKRIVKSKSMLTEEIDLNPRLESAGLQVTETDLGEWIVQLAGEKPSHFTAPAMHKTREQIAQLLSRATGERLAPDIPTLVDAARRSLRRAFIDADMGISGANIAIAENGTLVIVANEGNDRLVTTLPRIHVAVVGCEKLVETMDDANAILKLIARSGTGQKIAAYISFITGPSRTTDIEKTLTLGVHGPGEVHIVFVDSGRRAMAADPVLREALYCLKCGACLNLCPVYASIGGHAYGNAYVGGIGSALTAYHRDLDAAQDTLGLCATCSYCAEICPSRIDTAGMIVELRRRTVEARGMPIPERAPLAVLSRPRLFHGLLRAARAVQGTVAKDDGTLRDLPVLPRSRSFPALAPGFLRDALPDRAAGSDGPTAALYAGCMLDFIYPEMGHAIWTALESSGFTPVFPRDQACCGAPAYYAGDHAGARKLAVDNLLALESAAADCVITGCPTCAVMLRRRWGELLVGTAWEARAAKLAAKVLDFSQWAAAHLNRPEAVSAGEVVTYHDPCHQARGIGSSADSRRLLTALGMKLVEMEEPDQCCGFAGGFSLKQADISDAILARKLDDIERTGASVVVTDCPGCIMHIRGGLTKRGSAIEVCHSAQAVARVLE